MGDREELEAVWRGEGGEVGGGGRDGRMGKRGGRDSMFWLVYLVSV